jgi:hypothetical protein
MTLNSYTVQQLYGHGSHTKLERFLKYFGGQGSTQVPEKRKLPEKQLRQYVDEEQVLQVG